MRDSILLGIAMGVVGPLFGGFLFYFIHPTFQGMEIEEFVETLFSEDIFFAVISLGAFDNLGLFFLLLKVGKEQAAKGVIISTFVYAITCLGYKMWG